MIVNPRRARRRHARASRVPGAGDGVLIGAAFNVVQTAAVHTVRSLAVDGSLASLGGTLEFTQASQINGTLTMGALDDFPGERYTAAAR